ncbi:acyltransferase family protein, partial [Promicromonospora kroppenstedtii]|uniref:acyltransferase family protein n=1 Tax=Promicromonospora kroppenstedtii TaxID=440482 RepID=UPI0012F90E66
MTATTTRPAAPPDPTGVRTAAPPRTFRPEVQALRALAVLLVIVYHVDPALLPGGYIGVDVFFVISGFLITGHLWREASSTGRVSLRKFWAARARRILPASLVATVGTIGVALVLLPLDLLQLWWRQALASVFYVENWALAADAVDYQAAGNEPTAFQHFWSLGVEEQFYLFWPLLVVLALGLWSLRGGRRAVGEVRDAGGLRRLLLVVFGVVVVASLVWSVAEVRADNPVAYYSTLTRVWELGAGGLLALLMRDTERFRALRSTLAVGGVAAVVAAACL